MLISLVPGKDLGLLRCPTSRQLVTMNRDELPVPQDAFLWIIDPDSHLSYEPVRRIGTGSSGEVYEV